MRTERRGIVLQHPVTWYAIKGEGEREVSIYNLVAPDSAHFVRDERERLSPDDWLIRRRTELQIRSAAAKQTGQRQVVSALPPKALPRTWRGLRIDVHERSGRHFVVVEAYSLRGRPPRQVGWLVELRTEPSRVKQVLPVFTELLVRSRAAH
jgi:hypothetical protein